MAQLLLERGTCKRMPGMKPIAYVLSIIALGVGLLSCSGAVAEGVGAVLQPLQSRRLQPISVSSEMPTPRHL